jgi:hypothetical protein
MEAAIWQYGSLGWSRESGVLRRRAKMTPVVDQRLSEVIIIVVEKEAVTFLKKVNMGVERNVGVDTTETRCEVASEGDFRDGHQEAAATAFDTTVGRRVKLVNGREQVVEWGEELNVSEFVRIKMLESFWESKNGAYTTSAVAYSVEKQSA